MKYELIDRPNGYALIGESVPAHTCKFCDMIERVQKERGGYVAPEHCCELFEIMKAEFGATDYDDATKILRSLKAKVDYLEGVTKRLAALVDRYKNP